LTTAKEVEKRVFITSNPGEEYSAQNSCWIARSRYKGPITSNFFWPSSFIWKKALTTED
jgi:hypothetical protein